MSKGELERLLAGPPGSSADLVFRRLAAVSHTAPNMESGTACARTTASESATARESRLVRGQDLFVHVVLVRVARSLVLRRLGVDRKSVV